MGRRSPRIARSDAAVSAASISALGFDAFTAKTIALVKKIEVAKIVVALRKAHRMGVEDGKIEVQEEAAARRRKALRHVAIPGNDDR